MRVREFDVVEMAVEQGVRSGWMRAERKIEGPTPEQVQEEIITAVINAMCDWFEFDEEEVGIKEEWLEEEEELEEREPQGAEGPAEGR